MAKIEFSQRTIDQFWKRVEICEHGAYCEECCFEWVGSFNYNNYGRFDIPELGVRKFRAHIFSWIIYKNLSRLVPTDCVVCHDCNNNWCVNPAHLYTGSQVENRHDRIANKTHGFKLKEKEARLIRKAFSTGKYTTKYLAKRFGVGNTTINSVLRGVTWKFIDDGLQEKIDSFTLKKRKRKLWIR